MQTAPTRRHTNSTFGAIVGGVGEQSLTVIGAFETPLDPSP